MKLQPWLLGVGAYHLLAGSPAAAGPGLRNQLQGSLQPDELFLSQVRAPQVVRKVVDGLTQWVSKAASLQDLTFVNRFRGWLTHHSDVSEVDLALDQLEEMYSWRDCSSEGSPCMCESGRVRYGLGSTWTYKNFSQLFTCARTEFPDDPVPGALKMCQCHRQNEDRDWALCAYEGRSCGCHGGVARFGTEVAWSYKNFSKAFMCSNSDFGNDPVPGIVKACQCRRGGHVEEDVEGPGGTTEGTLLWSCGQNNSKALPAAQVLEQATRSLCGTPGLASLLEVYLDPRFQEAYSHWVDQHGWIEEAYVTYSAGKRHSKFEWMATNLVRSVHLFSSRPIVMVNFDANFEPPPSWTSMPNLIVYRMRPLSRQGPSFNFNKIRALIAARVATGVELDLDQVIFAGMDRLFAGTQRECTPEHPYPILPVHWMSRDAKRGQPYHMYRFTSWNGTRTMRWNHAHPTWSFWALPFLSEVLYDRLTVRPAPDWMTEDEDMLNVMLWQRKVNKAWCKFDLEPALYTDFVPKNIYYDNQWYPLGVPLLFYAAHNTKHIEDTDRLLTVMARCADPAIRERISCSIDAIQTCERHLISTEELSESSDSDDADQICCCVKSREDTPIFWEGEWYRDSSQVPTVDDRGNPRPCLIP